MDYEKFILEINQSVYFIRSRIAAVIPLNSTVSRKLRVNEPFATKIINLTYGKEGKTVIIMDSGHSFILAEEPEEVALKLWKR